MKLYFKRISAILSIILVIQWVIFPAADWNLYTNVFAEEDTNVRVNFQTIGEEVPDGYIPDYGDVYGNKNGYTYGWNIDHKDMTINRNTHSDSRLDGFSQFHENGIWEIELVSGDYDVTVNVGDAVYSSTNTINVEGVNYWNNAFIGEGEFLKETKTVTVSDGKLTIDQGALGEGQTKINYIEITKIASQQPNITEDTVPPTIPQNLTTENIKHDEITLRWDSATDDIALKGYILYRDDSEIATVMESVYYKDANLSSATTYTYTVVAIDEANNISGKSMPVVVTTEAASGQGIGLKGEYFNGLDFSDNKLNRTDAEIDFDWGAGSPDAEINADNFTVRWSGKVQPRFSETYTFYTETHGGVRLWIDDQLLINDWEAHNMTVKSGVIGLQAGQLYDIKMEYRENSGSAFAKLSWSSENQVKEVIPQSQLYPSFVPQVPTNIHINETSTSIQLTWDAVNDATGYEIEADGNIIDNGGSTSFVHEDLQPNTQYTYRIRSKIPGVVGTWSMAFICKTRVAAPDNVTAVIIDNTIEVSWDSAEGAVGYDIEVDGDVIDNGGSTTYLHENVMPDTEHTYRVRAKNDNGAGDWSTVIRKGISTDIPMNVNAAATSTSITVTWDPVEEASGYDIEVDGVIVDNGLNTMYIHNNLLANTQHSYRVRVRKIDSIGEWSGLIVQSTLPEPGKGIGLKAEYFQNNDLSELKRTRIDEAIDFDWKQDSPAPGIHGDEFSVSWTGQMEPRFSEVYTIYTETHGGVRLWVDGELLIDDWDAHNTTHNSGTISLEAGNRYDIKMQYKESNGISKAQLLWSSASQSKEVIPKSQLYPIGIPKNITTNSAEKSITIHWDAVTFADSYDIEVDGSIVENIAELSYTHEGLVPGTLHAYRVRANTSDIKGEWSPSITAATLLGKPSNVEVIATETSLAVSWESVEGAAAYDIEVDGIIINNGVNINFTHENLLSGTLHKYRVRAKSLAVTGGWTSIVDKWTLPDIPQNIQIASTSTSITIDWDEVRGATGYDVEAYGTAVDNGTSTTYTEEGINPNMQRAYRVRAKNSSGNGKWSNIIAKTTLPGISGSLQGTATDTTVVIQWDAIAGAIAYDLEIDGVIFENIQGTSYIHSGLAPNTEHRYRVRARSTEGVGSWSQIMTITTLPSIPQNLSAEVTPEGIKVTWDAVEGATGYDIEVDGQVIDNGANTMYLHTGIEPNTEHTYRVRAKNGEILSLWSGLITKTTLVGVPANLRATATSTEITIMWDMVVGATGYDIEVDGVIINNELSTTFIHENLTPNTEHVYRVRTRNAGGTGPWSEYLNVSTVLGTPTNIVTEATSSSIKLSWDPVSGATGYDVLVDGEVVDSGTNTFYEHTGLEPFSWHIYRVRAKEGSSTGEWSDGVTTATLLGTPSNVKGESISDQITVTWDDVVGATTYEIEVDGSMVEVGTENIFDHKNLSPNEYYTYRVRAINESVQSEWSELVTVYTAPEVPKNLQVTATTTNEITLVWDDVENATSYDIEVDEKIINTLNLTTFTHQNLEPNTMHLYRVRAQNEGAQSNWTEILEKNTVPEITVNVGKDNIFDLVVVAPKKENVDTRKIKVTYNPEDVDVVDLYAATPEVDLETGVIAETNISVEKFTPGEIIYTINNADKTVVNTIKFIAKTNEYSKITYTIE
ncbi:MAG: fibronectin type III domain-containing protein [Bacillota bacterium]